MEFDRSQIARIKAPTSQLSVAPSIVKIEDMMGVILAAHTEDGWWSDIGQHGCCSWGLPMPLVLGHALHELSREYRFD